LTGSRIYSNFASDISWIQDRIASDVSSLPRNKKAAGLYFTRQRLQILKGASLRGISPSVGRPVPYAAFWFADALSLKDSEFVRQMGLCMVYNSLTTTIKDDLEDSSAGNRTTLEFLRRYWNDKYDEVVNSIVPAGSAYWRTADTAKEQWWRYDEWNQSFDQAARFNPYSDRFLGSSSRYFVAVVLPPLAAIAAHAGRPREIKRIYQFLCAFSKGWRVFDDLMDWQRDIRSPHLNRSSVLYYLAKRLPPKTPMRSSYVMSSFLSREFVDDTYGAILRNLRSAGDVLAPLNNSYLSTFIREQLEFHIKRRDALLGSGGTAFATLFSVLSKTDGIVPQFVERAA
jgi:hypothetical protein